MTFTSGCFLSVWVILSLLLLSSSVSEGQRGCAPERGEGKDPERQHSLACVQNIAPCWKQCTGPDLRASGGTSQLPQALRPLQEQVSHIGGNGSFCVVIGCEHF